MHPQDKLAENKHARAAEQLDLRSLYIYIQYIYNIYITYIYNIIYIYYMYVVPNTFWFGSRLVFTEVLGFLT